MNDKSSEHIGSFAGTSLYIAPEMLYESSSGPFSDLWALGVIIYELETGSSPWHGVTNDELLQNILECNIPYPDTMDKDAKDLIQKLIVLNPLERLGVGEPGSDLDYQHLKNHPFFSGINW